MPFKLILLSISVIYFIMYRNPTTDIKLKSYISGCVCVRNCETLTYQTYSGVCELPADSPVADKNIQFLDPLHIIHIVG